mgnify:FL=1
MTSSGRAALEQTQSSTLVRRLGPLDGASIIVSNVIGSGIFIVPALVAGWIPNVWAMLAAWGVGGLLAFAGAMAYAELAVLRPHAGGEYVYLRDAFGPTVGFLTGWTSFVAGFSGAIAASAVGFAAFVGQLFPMLTDSGPFFQLSLGFISLTVSSQTLVALALIVVLTVVHVRGLGPGRVVQNILAVSKVAILIVLIVAGFSIGTGSIGNFTLPSQPITAELWLLALIPIMFSFSGWNAAAYVAGEIQNPERNVPLAMALGTVTVVVIFMGLNVLYVFAMPLSEIAVVDVRVIDAAAGRLLGPEVATSIAAASAVMIAASVSAMIMAGPRVYYAMARDGQFLSAASRVHPTFRTPVVAIVAQSIWSAVLVLAGTFDQLLLYTGFAVTLFAGTAVAALFVLRRRNHDISHSFRAWGYPVAPAVFVAVSAAMVVNYVWRQPVESGVGILCIVAGIPLYWMFKKT